MARKTKIGNELAQSVPTGGKVDPENDYEAQGHLDTLIRAHHIMNDAVKMGKVHALAGRHHKAIKSINDIKNAYQEKFGKKPSVGDLHEPKDNEPDGNDKE